MFSHGRFSLHGSCTSLGTDTLYVSVELPTAHARIRNQLHADVNVHVLVYGLHVGTRQSGTCFGSGDAFLTRGVAPSSLRYRSAPQAFVNPPNHELTPKVNVGTQVGRCIQLILLISYSSSHFIISCPSPHAISKSSSSSSSSSSSPLHTLNPRHKQLATIPQHPTRFMQEFPPCLPKHVSQQHQ